MALLLVKLQLLLPTLRPPVSQCVRIFWFTFSTEAIAVVVAAAAVRFAPTNRPITLLSTAAAAADREQKGALARRFYTPSCNRCCQCLSQWLLLHSSNDIFTCKVTLKGNFFFFFFFLLLSQLDQQIKLIRSPHMG